MTITTATWADLGYRKLGPGRRLDAAKTRLVADVVAKYGLHEIQTSGDERWVRDKARIQKAPAPWLIRRVASITKDSFGQEYTYAFIDRAARQRYAQTQQRVTASWDTLVSLTRAEKADSRWRWLYALSTAVSLADPDALATLLRLHALPAFFAVYPAGRVLFYESNYEYESRYGLLRGMYSLSHYDVADLQPDRGFATLRQWQTLDTLTQPRTLFTLLGVALYPYVHIETAGPIGLRVLFVLDPPERYEPPPFPSSWLSFPQSHWDFGDQERDHVAVLAGQEPSARESAAHGRFRHQRSFSSIEIETLVDWMAARFNELAFHLADPCEFVVDGCVDAVTTFEFALTVDRVLRKAISCVASEENAVRKAGAQEIADLLETLRSFRDPAAGKTAFFKQLHHATDGLALVRSCCAGMPQPFADVFVDSAKHAYDELVAAVRASVWVKSKLTAGGVMVKSKDLSTEKEESSADFSANVVRALRNAHHGYISEQDPSNRPSRYLAIITGDTPDSMAYLGTLWALALLSDPQKMLAWNWLPIANWP